MGQLYVVGTPIGNLNDFSPRAVETLQKVDFIAAEDTRVTLKLLNHFQIKKPMVSYYEHNLRERGRMIVDRILSGEDCAIVSDAGMPCISDPGEDLVRLCAENDIPVTVIPGPSAVISALAVSGLPTSRFTFEGFLSVNRTSRKEHLQSLRTERRTMLFYEAPHKLLATLADLRDTFGGDRPLTVCRELTKLHEETLRTTIDGAIAHFTEVAPKGEFVLVVAGAPEAQDDAATPEQALELARSLLAEGKKASEAARDAAKATGLKKSDIYRLLMEEKEPEI